jgi:hypothetical protein
VTEATEHTADNLDALLSLMGVDTLQDLSDQVEEHAEYDAWIPPAHEQDALPDELLVRIDDWGLHMPFPITASAFWETIDDAEVGLGESERDEP